ncbi:MAG: hypothetical protein ACRD1T_07125 [Acidimicrobiia bacterium]
MVGCFRHAYLPAATIKELDPSKQYRVKELVAGLDLIDAAAS